MNGQGGFYSKSRRPGNNINTLIIWKATPRVVTMRGALHFRASLKDVEMVNTGASEGLDMMESQRTCAIASRVDGAALSPLFVVAGRAIALAATMLAALGGLAAPAGAATEPAAFEFTTVSGSLCPAVDYALMKRAEGLVVVVHVAAMGPQLPLPRVDLGVAALRHVTLADDAATATHGPDGVRYMWIVSAGKLVDREADWDRLRLAFAVRWPGGPGAADIQRERFRCSDRCAPHDGLPPDPADWLALSMAEHEAQLAERRQRITIDLDQPMSGKCTVVIDDAQGRRIRNLVSGRPMLQGRTQVEWDGLDDAGRVVTPGDYRWRAISHPGVTPHYLFSFYNPGRPPWRDGSPGAIWLSDHGDAIAATAFGDRVYLAAPLSESGHTVIQVDMQGMKTAGVNLPASIGWGTIFVAADEKHFYALSEGHSGYAPMKDLPGGRWECTRPTSLIRWDLQGQMIPYKGPTNLEVVLAENRLQGTGSKHNVPLPDNLGGAVLVDAKLYVSLRQENRILVVDPETGRATGEIKLESPGFLAADRGSLVAFSGAALVRIDLKTQTAKPLFTPALSAAMAFPPGTDDFSPAKTARVVTGLAVSSAGEIFVSDNGIDQNVKVFSSEGKLLREVGRKGGRPLAGPWDFSGMYQPHGIAIDAKGQLWVTETDPMPRRISVWDSASGAFLRELFGPSRYGAPGAGFDPEDATRWVGSGASWKLDFAAGKAVPVSTLYHRTQAGQIDGELPAFLYHFYHRDGRTFLIAQGYYQSVYELLPDGRLKLWAVCGSAHMLANPVRWTLPIALTQAAKIKDLLAGQGEISGQFKDRVNLPEDRLRDVGIVLWVDRNGDGVLQPDEVEVSSPGLSIAGGWGAGNLTLDLRFLARAGNTGERYSVLTLSPRGMLPSGAPDYRLAESVAVAKPVRLPEATPGPAWTEIQSTLQDRFGRLLVNSSPMRALDAQGQELWTFPNRWVGVHGSHNAPLPEIGVMQGALYFLGSAPLDDRGDVTIINGNHGRFFVMTTDGMYVDEMFKDVRVTQQNDAYLIGGECFGGFFGRSRSDGKYYLQSGHTDYRIFRIDGLDALKRSEGALRVSAEQVSAAQRKLERSVAAAQQPRVAVVSQVSPDGTLDADPAKWPGDWAATWGNAARAFPYAQVKILRRGDQLHLAWRVKDPSPWVNRGSDWTLLFKTGDCAIFEFSTDPAARADRSTPVPGDRRLLIAPFQNKPLAVLYCYREPGTTHPVSFSSPWRAENVDRVTRLDSARMKVKTEQGAYVLTASIPLANLGLPATGSVSLKGDFGVIYGDDAGTIDLLRSHWSNQVTGLVNDVPGEIMINPKLWGTLRLEEAHR